MSRLLRAWRVLGAAEIAVRILRVLVLVRAALPILRTAVRLWKRKGR